VNANILPAPTEIENPWLHVALIMDGNGRGAQQRGLSRLAGHRAGGNYVRDVVEAAPGLGITTLTLYAFSSDNWSRPRKEVSALMRLFHLYLIRERDACIEQGVRVNVIGRRDRLRPSIVEQIEKTENATAAGRTLHLRLAVDYSSRDAILGAARLASECAEELTQDGFASLINRAIHSEPAAPDVDLLIRTSGEQRISDYLLWEIAHAELFFTELHWPDFRKEDLADAVAGFRRRERRFGGL
jgi:undecaprenyl diphosphate synthase